MTQFVRWCDVDWGYSQVIDVSWCRVHSKLLKAFVDRLLSFLWPKAARDAHFEQTSALFRWGGGILKYFSLLNSESYAGPTWKHLDRLGKFLVGERSIDQMKQIPRIQGILHQLKLVALKKLNPAQRSRLHDETMVKMEYNQGICPFLLYFSTFCGWHPVFWISPNNPLLLTK